MSFSFSKADRAAIREARANLSARGSTALLGKPDSNPKLAKSGKVGAFALPMHLAPARLSGFEVCPARSGGCTAACIHKAGNPVYMRQKELSRIARTRFYFEARDQFMALLVSEIAAHIKRAARHELIPAFRLNATSDIPWERVPVRLPSGDWSNIMEIFPQAVFYDYTKRHNRFDLPRNYSLTFSLAEDNDSKGVAALTRGLNVAVVFNRKRGQPLPSYWRLGSYHLPVVDGDQHDFRPIDPTLSFVGLRAKGDALTDESGFVRSAD